MNSNDNKIEVKVTVGGLSQSVFLDPPPPALGVKYYETKFHTEFEIQELRKRLKTFDAANLWQANRIKELESQSSDARRQTAETRDRADKLELDLKEAKERLANSDKRIDEPTKQLAGAKSNTLTVGPNGISFDAATGEPNVGFQVGDVWYDDGRYKRTITHVFPNEVHYELSDQDRDSGFRMPDKARRYRHDWSWRVQKVIKFVRSTE